jgi:5-formyltetrahydrofolate cyclo-ligase
MMVTVIQHQTQMIARMKIVQLIKALPVHQLIHQFQTTAHQVTAVKEQIQEIAATVLKSLGTIPIQVIAPLRLEITVAQAIQTHLQQTVWMLLPRVIPETLLIHQIVLRAIQIKLAVKKTARIREFRGQFT